MHYFYQSSQCIFLSKGTVRNYELAQCRIMLTEPLAQWGFRWLSLAQCIIWSIGTVHICVDQPSAQVLNSKFRSPKIVRSAVAGHTARVRDPQKNWRKTQIRTLRLTPFRRLHAGIVLSCTVLSRSLLSDSTSSVEAEGIQLLRVSAIRLVSHREFLSARWVFV